MSLSNKLNEQDRVVAAHATTSIKDLTIERKYIVHSLDGVDTRYGTGAKENIENKKQKIRTRSEAKNRRTRTRR